LLDVSIDGSRAILFNIKGGEDLSLFEVNEAAEIVRASAHPEANIIFGAVVDSDIKDEVQLTVIATGFDRVKVDETPLGQFSQRSYESQRHYDRSERSDVRTPPSGRPISTETTKANGDYLVRTFDREDLDIPAFLRRTRNNGKSFDAHFSFSPRSIYT
jgi:cell division protein FtsZ